MKWENFTAERVAEFKCKLGVKQSIYWDGKTPGLGLRVTSADSKSYIFETKLHGRTLRITIGSPKAWPLGKAQKEASRLKVMTDQGIDPRQVKADEAAAKETAIAAMKAQEDRETLTVGNAWDEYVVTMKSAWGELHLHDHVRAMHPGAGHFTSSEQPGDIGLSPGVGSHPANHVVCRGGYGYHVFSNIQAVV